MWATPDFNGDMPEAPHHRRHRRRRRCHYIQHHYLTFIVRVGMGWKV